MDIKNSSEFKLSRQEVQDIVMKYLMKSGNIAGDVDMDKVMINDMTKTEVQPGADIHDAYYEQVFDGFKITVEQNSDEKK